MKYHPLPSSVLVDSPQDGCTKLLPLWTCVPSVRVTVRQQPRKR